MKIFRKLDTKHVSDIDKLLNEFDQKNPEKSTSQQQEIKKFERINKLRDEEQAEK